MGHDSSMRHAYAKRRDANEPDIVAALEAVGAWVHRFDSPVDLLVDFRGAIALVEVKDGRKSPADRPLTPAQVKFFERALLRGIRAFVVRSVAESVCAIGAIPCGHGACGCGRIADPWWFAEARKVAAMERRKRK